MLTTEEIKKALDTGNAVGLECVDVDMYCRADSAFKHEREVIARSSLVITSIIGQGDFKALMISDCRYCIPENDLKHFRIKRPTPTFDDLIDVAVQAKKDGIVSEIHWSNNQSLSVLCAGGLVVSATEEVTSAFIRDAINDINSLYTETFVIESEEDVARSKIDSITKLTNGQELQCRSSNLLIYRDEDDRTVKLSFCILKGATVTQKRGAQ